jgi:hypothetical protein
MSYSVILESLIQFSGVAARNWSWTQFYTFKKFVRYAAEDDRVNWMIGEPSTGVTLLGIHLCCWAGRLV